MTVFYSDQLFIFVHLFLFAARRPQNLLINIAEEEWMTRLQLGSTDQCFYHPGPVQDSTMTFSCDHVMFGRFVRVTSLSKKSDLYLREIKLFSY